MSITSLNFFYAFLVVLIVYYVLPRRSQNYWLLFVSYAFYTSWSWKFSLILLFLTLVNFLIAKHLEKNQDIKTRLFWLGIAINVSGLIILRITDYFLPELINILSNLGIQLSQESIAIILPIGMAFYTLQNISYLIDVYRQQTTAAQDFIDFALYLAYFPKILSGPVERARTFLPKLAQDRHVDNHTIARGFLLIIMGLIRKLFIAGILSAIIFWDAFETPQKYTGPELFIWIVIYGLFLYNDFAGYTNIARGISALLGIELSHNFKQPYFARNMVEFWNSWHISFSHWLRDYIYFPLSRTLLRRNRNQRHAVNLILPPLVTMIVSGLWHGLGWHMLLWGTTHGVYQVVERLFSLRGPVVPPHQQPYWRQILSAIVVFILVSFAWVPFVTETSVTFGYWLGMLDWTFPTIRYRRMLLFIPIFIAVLAVDWFERQSQDDAFFLRWPRWSQAVLLAASLFFLIFLMQGQQQDPFVYQGF